MTGLLHPAATLEGVNLPRRLWLRMRRTGLGGSDASVLWGHNPWRSPFTLWAEKAGLLDDDDDNEAMKWGRILEAPVASEAAARYHLEILDTGAAMFRSVEWPWMVANPDRIVREHPEEWWVRRYAGVEIKTSGEWMLHEWDDDEVPAPALWQAVHCMAVLGLDAWWVFGLIGGNKLRGTRVERDAELEALHVERCERFWTSHVVAGEPPEPDGWRSTTDTLARLYSPSDPDLVVELPPELVAVARDLRTARADAKRAKNAEQELRNRILAGLGHAEVGVVDGRAVVTARTSKPRRVFNAERFREDDPDRHDSYVETVEGTRPVRVLKELT